MLSQLPYKSILIPAVLTNKWLYLPISTNSYDLMKERAMELVNGREEFRPINISRVSQSG
jgi:hypothetical protein